MNYFDQVVATAQRMYVVRLSIALVILVVVAIGFAQYVVHDDAGPIHLVPVEPLPDVSTYAAPDKARRFRILVADQVADPEQRNTILRDTGGTINDIDRIAAIGSLGSAETDGYDADLLWIAHNIITAAGWYTTHAGLRDAMLRRCSGRVYHDDECYAAFLGALIAHRVPRGYVAKSGTIITTNPLRGFVNGMRSLPSMLGF